MKVHGISYIEVLITLVVVAVIALSAQPAAVSLDGYRTLSQGYSIASLFQTGSNIAIAGGNQVILCPTTDRARCVNTWNDDHWMLFINTNNDSTRNSSEELLLLHQPNDAAFIQFGSSSQSPRFLRWYPGGHINRAFSLIICPQNADATNANVLIVNLQGRVRPGVDSNSDDIVELANNQNATCENTQ